MGRTTRREKLTTQDAVERIPLSPTGQPIATLDTDIKGFMVLATKNVKSYYVQRHQGEERPRVHWPDQRTEVAGSKAKSHRASLPTSTAVGIHAGRSWSP